MQDEVSRLHAETDPLADDSPEFVPIQGEEPEAPVLSGQSLALLKEMPIVPGAQTKEDFVPTRASILPARVAHDPDRRTVVVLDRYGANEMLMRPDLGGDYGFSHGELSARMAEENGFNVVRMQIGYRKPGFMDIPGALADLNAGIEDGSIKLQRGDVLNVSLSVETSFADASRMLGMDITAENLREKRDEMIDAMRSRVDDPRVSKEDRAILRHALLINDGVAKLQEKGIEVVTPAGNKGADRFNLGMLLADRQYSALTRDGEVAAYSARNSLTTDGVGDIDFRMYPVNALDPTPLAEQEMKYRLAGTNVYLSADDFGGSLEMSQIDLTANPLRFSQVEFPLTAPNVDSWIYGTVTMSEQGTSFVNVHRLPVDYPADKD